MLKTILIPTDFSIRSLQVVKHAIDRNPNEKLNVVHATGITISDSITRLLFFSKKDLAKKLPGDTFNEACQVISNKYVSQINEMKIDIFTGITQVAFNHFTAGLHIDAIYLSENKLNYRHPRFDLTPFVLQSKLPKNIVSWHEAAEVTEDNHITELFASWA